MSDDLSKKYGISKSDCPSGKMARFAEPCLLFFLSQKDSYGYELISRLEEFGFSGPARDPAMVYRTLRCLENRGFVASTWDTEGSGPAKRNYRLTEKGVGLLALWAENIERRTKVLEKFLAEYGRHTAKKEE